jgi:hypothetical protein
VGPATFDLLVANDSFTWLDTMSWVKGRHQLKFGTQIVRNQDNKALLFQRTVTYQTLDDFARNGPFCVSARGQSRAGMRSTYDNPCSLTVVSGHEYHHSREENHDVRSS